MALSLEAGFLLCLSREGWYETEPVLYTRDHTEVHIPNYTLSVDLDNSVDLNDSGTGDCSFIPGCPDPYNHTETILFAMLFDQ